jgi:hypothetical protein
MNFIRVSSVMSLIRVISVLRCLGLFELLRCLRLFGNSGFWGYYGCWNEREEAMRRALSGK